MKAVRNTERGIEVVDLPPPTGEGVRIAVESAGICGSDLAAVEQGPLPFTLGHEAAGVCEDGTPVGIEPLLPCGVCDQCERQAYHRCRRGAGSMLGFACDGGMAEELLVPERCLVPLPAGLDPRNACLIEPLAVVLHGLRLAELEAGASVAVIGGGTIGQLCVAAARAFGAEVALQARHPAQRVAGERLGARSIDEGEYDLVVDCAGSQSALEDCCERARPGGTFVLLGVYYGQVGFPGMELLTKEVRVLPSITYNRHAGGRDVDAAAALLASNSEIIRAVITHRFPLKEAPAAFRVAGDRSAGAIKVVLEP